MRRYVSKTTTEYTTIGDALDTYVSGAAQIKLVIANTGAASLLWQVQASNDATVWETVKAEAAVTSGLRDTYSESPPSYRYYRAQVKAQVQTTAVLTAYRTNYVQEGSYFGVAITSESIEAAEGIIDRLTNDHFAPRYGALKLDGNGRRRVFLTQATALRLLDLESIKITDQTTPEGVVYTPPSDQLIVEERSITLHPAATTVSAFYRGHQNVLVTGTWGHRDTPSEIIWSTQRLAAQMKDGGTLASSTGSYVMEKIADYTYQSGVNTNILSDTSGDAAIDRILNNWRNVAPDLLADMGIADEEPKLFPGSVRIS